MDSMLDSARLAQTSPLLMVADSSGLCKMNREKPTRRVVPGVSDMITDAQKQVLDLYNEALGLYKNREWKEAKAKFKEALKIDPEDGPSKLYVERCNLYLKNPPGDDWDGVFIMTTK